MLKPGLAALALFFSELCSAADQPQTRPVLNFEIAVPPETQMGLVVTGSLRKVFQDLGYDLRFMNFPPKRGLIELKAGRVDGSAGRSGSLTTLLRDDTFVRINFPIVVFRITRWCRADVATTKAPIKVGIGLGYLLMNLLLEHIDSRRVEINTIPGHKSGVQMLRAGRLDCLLSNELILETEGVTASDLKGLERFDVMTIEASPWISKRHEHLKKGIEAGLKSFPFPDAYRKKFQDLTPACEGTLNLLCADGILFTKKIDFR